MAGGSRQLRERTKYKGRSTKSEERKREQSAVSVPLFLCVLGECGLQPKYKERSTKDKSLQPSAFSVQRSEDSNQGFPSRRLRCPVCWRCQPGIISLITTLVRGKNAEIVMFIHCVCR